MTGEGEGGEGEGDENCHPLITSLLNEGAVIKRVIAKYKTPRIIIRSSSLQVAEEEENPKPYWMNILQAWIRLEMHHIQNK